MQNDSSLHYRIFVLTVWLEEQTDADNPSLWRVRLEDPRSKEQVGCVGTHGLPELLNQQLMQKSTPKPPAVDE